MMFKAIVVPLALILFFGGGFVALTKPYNTKAILIVFGLATALLVLGLATGLPKWIAGLGLLAAIFGFMSRKKL